jgi:hypothetical protein
MLQEADDGNVQRLAAGLPSYPHLLIQHAHQLEASADELRIILILFVLHNGVCAVANDGAQQIDKPRELG